MDKKQKTIKPKVVFIGTPDFAATILTSIVRCSLFSVCCVITAPDKPVGRKQILTPSLVKILAKKYEINIIQPNQIQNSKLEIQNLNPDLIIIAAYGQILPKEILEIPKYGCLNVHPSLLPKYRGPSPVQHAILNGDKKAGVTIMLMDEKMDHGPILAQRELKILNSKSQILNKSKIQNPKITYEELLKKLTKLGANLLIETIPKWVQGGIEPKPQNESEATYTKIIKKQDGKINWGKPAEEIERQVRAFNPWPGTYTNINLKEKEKLLKILKVDILEQIKNDSLRPIGKIFSIPNNKVAVQTKKNYLIIEELQLEGGQKMTIVDFLRGHPDFIDAIVY